MNTDPTGDSLGIQRSKVPDKGLMLQTMAVSAPLQWKGTSLHYHWIPVLQFATGHA